jgi:hypothetical protein
MWKFPGLQGRNPEDLLNGREEPWDLLKGGENPGDPLSLQGRNPRDLLNGGENPGDLPCHSKGGTLGIYLPCTSCMHPLTNFSVKFQQSKELLLC